MRLLCSSRILWSASRGARILYMLQHCFWQQRSPSIDYVTPLRPLDLSLSLQLSCGYKECHSVACPCLSKSKAVATQDPTADPKAAEDNAESNRTTSDGLRRSASCQGCSLKAGGKPPQEASPSFSLVNNGPESAMTGKTGSIITSVSGQDPGRRNQTQQAEPCTGSTEETRKRISADHMPIVRHQWTKPQNVQQRKTCSRIVDG